MRPTYLKTVSVVEDENGNFTVAPVWANVDRPTTCSICTGKNRNLAKRLARAWYAGVVYDQRDVTVEVDIHGKSYANVSTFVRGRTLNADLKKLGF